MDGSVYHLFDAYKIFMNSKKRILEMFNLLFPGTKLINHCIEGWEMEYNKYKLLSLLES